MVPPSAAEIECLGYFLQALLICHRDVIKIEKYKTMLKMIQFVQKCKEYFQFFFSFFYPCDSKLSAKCSAELSFLEINLYVEAMYFVPPGAFIQVSFRSISEVLSL